MTTSPSMIAEPAAICQASSATLRKRLVQSWPRRVKTLTAYNEVHLHAIAVELDFVDPSLAAGDLVDRCRKGRLNEARTVRFDAVR